jgi:hypothetical protein
MKTALIQGGFLLETNSGDSINLVLESLIN